MSSPSNTDASDLVYATLIAYINAPRGTTNPQNPSTTSATAADNQLTQHPPPLPATTTITIIATGNGTAMATDTTTTPRVLRRSEAVWGCTLCPDTMQFSRVKHSGISASSSVELHVQRAHPERAADFETLSRRLGTLKRFTDGTIEMHFLDGRVVPRARRRRRRQ